MVYQTRRNTIMFEDCERLQRTLSESRVRENRMHGLKRGAGSSLPLLYWIKIRSRLVRVRRLGRRAESKEEFRVEKRAESQGLRAKGGGQGRRVN